MSSEHEENLFQEREQQEQVILETLPSGVAILRLGHPREKTIVFTERRLRSLQEMIAQVRAIKPSGLIITGPNSERMFSVGADVRVIKSIKESSYGKELALLGQDIFTEVSELSIPTVAAIGGPCVGGGLELALACRYRICADTPSTRLSLPEIQLGIIPGFGGTQRLPRLIGISQSIPLILSGKALRPHQALQIGLVDEVTPPSRLLLRAENLLQVGNKNARTNLSFNERLLTGTSLGRYLVKRRAVASLQENVRFYPAPLKALDAIFYGLSKVPFLGAENPNLGPGLLREAESLSELIVTPECKALVNVYELTEYAKGLGKIAKEDLNDLRSLVVGAGVMGSGIALLLALNNIPVILVDANEEALQKSKAKLEEIVGAKSSLSQIEKREVLQRINFTKRPLQDGITPTTMPELKDVSLIIEAVVENLEVKRELLTRLSSLVSPGALIASNTSSLSITSISSGIPHPERVVGMHFFNPVEKMPLLEIVRGEKTSSKAFLVATAIGSKLGKYPIIVQDAPGFLVNRILASYLKVALHLLGRGFSISAIEEGALTFGMPMGPFRLLDEVGLDIAVRVTASLSPILGGTSSESSQPEDYLKAPNYLGELVKRGFLGKKSGRGFYDFSTKPPTLNRDLSDILNLPEPTKVAPELITDALIFSLLQEALLAYESGIAGVPGPDAAKQVDLGCIMGFGFPPFRGGLLHYAGAFGLKNCVQIMRQLKATFGDNTFTPPQSLLSKLENNELFY
jgi:3-hydroxyacyl-CoA dehydrogenase/enoyl-CoA hydratase/3-hydroxybutyryl-CoA epimerase